MERRSHFRIPLDIPLFIRLFPQGREGIRVMLVDISQGGMQVSLPPHYEDYQKLLGLDLLIQDFAFDMAAQHKGKVLWVSRERCGVCFEPVLPYTEKELEQILCLL